MYHILFIQSPVISNLNRHRDVKIKEAFGPPKFNWQEASWENGYAVNLCYLSCKRSDTEAFEGWVRNHWSVISRQGVGLSSSWGLSNTCPPGLQNCSRAVTSVCHSFSVFLTRVILSTHHYVLGLRRGNNVPLVHRPTDQEEMYVRAVLRIRHAQSHLPLALML